MIDHAAADYCPCCGQPREKEDRVMRFGLELRGYMLSFGDRRDRLRPAVAKFLRPLVRVGTASHEMLVLNSCPNSDDNHVRVLAKFLRHKLSSLTGDAIQLRNIHGWGYELVDARQQRLAA
jgi:hypothetical protein